MALVELKLKGMAAPVTVVTPGTPVPLSATSMLVSGFALQISPANTNPVYVKDTDGNICMILSGGSPTANFMADDTEADEDDVVWDLSKIFIDSTGAGQSVYVSYYVLESINYNR